MAVLISISVRGRSAPWSRHARHKALRLSAKSDTKPLKYTGTRCPVIPSPGVGGIKQAHVRVSTKEKCKACQSKSWFYLLP